MREQKHIHTETRPVSAQVCNGLVQPPVCVCVFGLRIGVVLLNDDAKLRAPQITEDFQVL